MSTRWKNVIFDLDGTLANTVPLILASYEHALKTVLNQELDVDLAKTWIGRTLMDAFMEHAPDQAEDLEREYLKFNAEHLPDMVTEFEGIPRLLADLVEAGANLGVVTAKRRSVAHDTFAPANLPDDLAIAAAMEDTPVHKPNPEPILLGMKTIGADPASSVYVGDAIYDLQAAAAAGIDGVGVTWGAGVPEQVHAQPNAGIADTVDELRSILFN